MLMEPSSYSFQDDFFNGEIAPMPMWSLSPEVNFDLTGFELLPEPVEPPPVACRHAFEKYVRPNESVIPVSGGNCGDNIHKRIIATLRNMKREMREGKAAESSRGFRHMMRERQRREKLSQSYADLYAMLASRSKGDKNSIVQSAAIYIRELKGVKDQLQQKNEELKAKILGIDACSDSVRVKFEVANPNSGLDSMIGALKRLRSMDVKSKAIRCDVSSNCLSTTMTIQTKMAACEVEKEIEEALKDVERDSQSHALFPGNNTVNTWSHNSHMGNAFGGSHLSFST
ncbi:Basic helix-loop-helix (bHLH) DNA-binding family protein [Rhynchospora pubera]|uniref:Basic helix-loop-helix (BHLH) DNA-binding family protein n=1 Tax=Rhynchospora pubera TaxID=906938 RepID=A0AAV8D7F8_9POAL|nr:Basic helix-loop-helix (bHLH) DNA-binding family protein [Rhynchospora pubera]